MISIDGKSQKINRLFIADINSLQAEGKRVEQVQHIGLYSTNSPKYVYLKVTANELNGTSYKVSTCSFLSSVAVQHKVFIIFCKWRKTQQSNTKISSPAASVPIFTEAAQKCSPMTKRLSILKLIGIYSRVCLYVFFRTVFKFIYML